jgi:hypothetical protein
MHIISESSEIGPFEIYEKKRYVQMDTYTYQTKR